MGVLRKMRDAMESFCVVVPAAAAWLAAAAPHGPGASGTLLYCSRRPVAASTLSPGWAACAELGRIGRAAKPERPI